MKYSMPWIVALLLILVLFIGVNLDHANSQEVTHLVITKKRVNIRQGPSTKQKVIKTVSKGDEAVQLDIQGNWRKVRFEDGTIGWVYHTLVSEKSRPKPPVATQTGRAKPAKQQARPKISDQASAKPAQPKIRLPGNLTIESHPSGAVIYLNGTRRSESTPCSLVVPEGNYKVELQLAGYESAEINIPVEADQEALVSMQLQILPGSLKELATNRKIYLLTGSLFLSFIIVVGTVMVYRRRLRYHSYSLQTLKNELNRADELLKEAVKGK